MEKEHGFIEMQVYSSRMANGSLRSIGPMRQFRFPIIGQAIHGNTFDERSIAKRHIHRRLCGFCLPLGNLTDAAVPRRLTAIMPPTRSPSASLAAGFPKIPFYKYTRIKPWPKNAANNVPSASA